MKITRLTPDETGLVDWPMLSRTKRAAVTVGTFDGLHLGHRTVIERVVAKAKETGSFAVVIMFDPRPGMVHGYAKTHADQELPADAVDAGALSSVTQRLRALEGMGVDHVLVVHYTLAFAAKSYRFFLGQLVGKLGMRTLVLGADATMGAGQSGNVKDIQRLAEATRVFDLDVVEDCGPGYVRVPRIIEPHAPEGLMEPEDPRKAMDKAALRAWSKANECRNVRVWSSSNVRYLLSQGCVQDANDVLGHAHAVEGTVVHGEQMGRTMGFPTANLAVDTDGYVPVDGVYAGWLVDLGPADEESGEAGEGNFKRDLMRMMSGSQWRWPAAISIGTKPTYRDELGEVERVIEPYAITDDWLELYGHRVRVEFTGFLRAQVAFSGTEELTKAMKDYCDQTLEINARLEGKK